VPFVPLTDVAAIGRNAEAVAIGVSDDAIASVCEGLATGGAFVPGQFVFHLSGSLGLDVLAPAADTGAEVLSIHPLQSFPTVERGLATFEGSGVAVTSAAESGAAFGEMLARDAGGVPFRIAEEAKALYHAAAVYCANYLVTVEAAAEDLFRRAGLEEPIPLFAPLARAVLEKALAEGPRDALTGPAVRGDAGTIQRNLEALKGAAPQYIRSYADLARLAAGIASETGRLDDEQRTRIEKLLDRWK
jgi:predicted short-subunit dehydrogenase-like oxidoreductase (DUF2520 family)